MCMRVCVCKETAHNLVACGMRQRVFIGRYFTWSRSYNGKVISERRIAEEKFTKFNKVFFRLEIDYSNCERMPTPKHTLLEFIPMLNVGN